ncbi:oxidoreductase [Frankia torreyi]|uniref:Oxidoreductase n=1 Tax=Frankia torreyi TaxID=1856 RepID=A0A0D8B6X3_9ACTN|nr:MULTISPECIES: LLM class F420-dependent oxidoreductase [Frankia]KJE20038.1 oxidoreductase [Frankia torreyi]
MHVTVEFPVSDPHYSPELVTAAGVTRVVQAAERLGYAAVAFTEHPAPSLKWLRSGGHEALDVVPALAFCAAATTRLRLMTYLLVLPYRNPLLTARAAATVDILSEGRLTVVVGTGYLRSEFRALGVDFDERNLLFDEALEVLRGVWSRSPFDYEGRHFTAASIAALPMPVTPDGPPIWVGGNSAVARRRAARVQGWSPLMIPDSIASTTRTPALTSFAQLRSAVTEVNELASRERGRDVTVDVQLQSLQSTWLQDPNGSPDEHLDFLGQARDAGATWFVVQPPGHSVAACIDALERYADVVRLSSSTPTGRP